jgi:hypothetical protein
MYRGDRGARTSKRFLCDLGELRGKSYELATRCSVSRFTAIFIFCFAFTM